MALSQAGGGISIPYGPMFNPATNMAAAGEQFNSIFDRVAKREKNKTIRDVLTAVPEIGPDGNPVGAESFRQSQLERLGTLSYRDVKSAVDEFATELETCSDFALRAKFRRIFGYY